jgi:hypothetical protein
LGHLSLAHLQRCRQFSVHWGLSADYFDLPY